MYSRTIGGRELFARSAEGNNERWSQPLEGSQEWPSQICGSQESQRLSVPSYRPQQVMVNSSQGSGSVVGPPPGGQSNLQGSPAPWLDLRDLTLAGDIRYGLHTILSVIQGLPKQLTEVSSQVSRSSKESEMTRKLIADTSNSLQVLVSSLQDKLSHLVQNKECAEDVRLSLAQREEEISALMAKLEELNSACKQQNQSKVVTLIRQTRKELRRELKKMCAAVEDMKRLEPEVKSLQSDVKKVDETVRTEIEELRSSLMNKSPPADPHKDFFISTQQSLDQVQSSVKDMMEKMSSLPKDIAMQVGQVIREMVHAGSGTYVGGSSSSNSLVSPIHRAFYVHRPMFPLAESVHQCQVSPVAHVSPISQVSMTPPVTCHAQPAVGRSTAPQPRLTPLLTPNAQLETDSKAGVTKDCGGVSEKEAEHVGCASTRLEQDSTEHFTPQKTYTLLKLSTDSPGQESLVLDCNSSSSENSPVVLSSITRSLNTTSTVSHTDDWVEESKEDIKWLETNTEAKRHSIQPFTSSVSNLATGITVKREVMTPNVRKTPCKSTGGLESGGILRKLKARESGGGEVMEGISAAVTPSQPKCEVLDPHPFVVPIGPPSLKRRKPDNSLSQGKDVWFSKEKSVNEASLNYRARRYLTPQTKGNLKLMILQSNKKVIEDLTC